MLDKSVPYFDLFMKRPVRLTIARFALPEGYRLVFYQPGDEQAWAEIETSVLEFSEEAKALAYFSKTFLPYPEELARRMLFVENPEGKKVATCTAWWTTTNGARVPLLHWLAVMPEAQGHGLGTILATEVTRLLQALEDNQPIYLITQTWSHPAIGIYEKLGYTLTKEDVGRHKNDKFTEAMAALEQIRSKKR